MNITCPRCGNPIAPNARICNRCGAPVNNYDQTVRMQQPGQQPYVPQPFPQKKNNNTMLLVVITFLLIIAIIFLAVFLFSSSKKKAAPSAVKTEQTTGTTQQDAPKDRLAQLQEVVSQRHLTSSEADELSTNDKRLLRNYIYARHGYIFSDRQLSNYFSQFDWYAGRYTSQDQVERMFNTYERANVQKLTEHAAVQQQTLTTSTYHEFIGHCNIRQYPTESSAIIATREDGDICYIADRSGDWYYIILPNGTEGWTHRQNLRAGR